MDAVQKIAPRIKFAALAFLVISLLPAVQADNLQRLGHTTLTPRHSLPDDKGMYAAVIDPTNGYAYFFGNYLFKLDITGNLPVQVGTNAQTGQFSEGAIDPALGYAYMPRAGNPAKILIYTLGAGTNSASNAGTFTLAESSSPALSIVVDDSSPALTNHYAYVFCSGNPGKVVKLSLYPTIAEVSSTNLPGQNAFAWGLIDKKNGYVYFASYILFNAPAIPQVLKIKLTPGTNAPALVGMANLGATAVPLWTSSIDTMHGYAYYATDNGTTNVPETLFKVKLGEGDALPSPVPFDGVLMHTNEVQMISNVNDPVNGFVYLGDDNTYPGRIYQFAMNGTNPPVELGYLSLQTGAGTPPPDGVSGNNTTTNSDGILPLGEVYLRSAVFDPVRGFAYFGQDSRPNQVVKIQPAQINPFVLSHSTVPNAGAFQFSFSNIIGETFNVLAATNLAQPFANWTPMGVVTDSPPGQYQFTYPQPATGLSRFYRVSGPE